MTDGLKYQIAFASSLIVGIGFCIGAIWIPPLAAVGTAFLGVAGALFKAAFIKKETPSHESTATNDEPAEEEAVREESQETILTHYEIHLDEQRNPVFIIDRERREEHHRHNLKSS